MIIYLTTLKIPYELVKDPCDYHKFIKKTFFDPSEHLRTPTFFVESESFDGIILKIYSDREPKKRNFVLDCEEYNPDLSKKIDIYFKYAAIKQMNGHRHSYERSTERCDICKKMQKVLTDIGCDVFHIDYTHRGIMHDTLNHNNTFPYGFVDATVEVKDKELFRSYLLQGIGREKFLGCGLINIRN